MEGEKKKKMSLYPIHAIIGVAITVIFWVIPQIDPITPVGMRCVGAFLGMVYMWSAIGTLWPSLYGLFAIAISGYAGDGLAGFNAVWMNAVGVNTVLLCLFAMVLFGALDELGITKYIARFLLTRKFYAGKPIMFLSVFFFTCFVLSTLVSPIVSMIMLWPVAKRMTDAMNLTREDGVWKFFYVGMFGVSTLGQPFFPFMGAQLIPCSAFQTMSGMAIPMGQYMLMNALMTFIVMTIYLLFMKFGPVDLSKMKAVDPAMIENDLNLPPMDFRQKVFSWMVPIYLLLVLVPSFFPTNPICAWLNSIGVMGITIAFCIILIAWKWNGQPMLNYQDVCYRQMNWGIFFMIAAAVYAAGTLSAQNTGVTAFLLQVLNPVLGGQPEMIFVALMFTVALIITNFANNAAMAVVLTPVVLAFSAQLGINPMPVEVGVILMVFVAMLTPAASPHAGMMWGRRDLYSAKDIMIVGFPLCVVTLLCYIFIAYPIMKVLFV